jgi:hypothetical protein
MLPAARGRDDHTEDLLNRRWRAGTAFTREVCASGPGRRLSEEITVLASDQQSTAPDAISAKSSHAPFWLGHLSGTALI